MSGTPFDTGNQLLAPVPAELGTAILNNGGEQRLALTIRTATTTLTVLLSAADAQTWADQLADTASQMSKRLLVASAYMPVAPS